MKPGKVSRAACAVLLCAQMFPAALRADDASRRASAEELFTLIHMDRTYGQPMSQVTAQTNQMVNQMFPQSQFTDHKKQELADFQTKVMTLVQSSLSWEAIKPDYIKLYADSYTDEELAGIIGFYKSSVGQAMLEKTPALIQAPSALSTARMQAVTPKLRQMMEDFQKQAAAEQGSSPAPKK